MAQNLVLKCKGLHTFANELSDIPEGGLVKADNIVIDADDIAKSRRGFKTYDNGFGDASSRSSKLLSYKNVLINHFETTLARDNGNGTWTPYAGAYSAPSLTTKIRGHEANSNFYFTTSDGVKFLDSITSTPRNAGVPSGLEITGALNSSGSGFLVNGSTCAYVVIWGYKDINNNLKLGPPSQVFTINNSSGSGKNIDLEFSIPQEVDTNFFYQVYRSKEVVGTPSPDYYLVYEANPTSLEITAKKIAFTDILPVSLNKGVAAYTSQSREGIGLSNERPPFSHDIASFKNMMFYANFKRNHNLNLTILSVLGTNGIQDGTVLTIAGITYTADDTAEYIPTSPSDVNNAKFLLSSASDPGTAIEETALNLVKVINRNPKNSFVYAYYMSGTEELPGLIYIEARSSSIPIFSVTASANGTAFNPSLLTPRDSTNEQKINGICWSKLQEPESVPLAFTTTLGAGDKAIIRIIPVRDSLFVFKEDGIFQGQGDTPENMSWTTYDITAKLMAPDSAVVLNNMIYFFSDQGISTVSDNSGVGVISRPIEGDIIKFLSSEATFFKQATHAIGYETDRKYILFTISEPTDTVANQAYIFNTFTNSWTRWDLGSSSAILNPKDDRIYLARNDSNILRVERKTFDARDYADEEFTKTIISFDQTEKTIVLNSTTELRAGMIMTQDDLECKIIEVVDSTKVIVDIVPDFEIDDVEIFTPIKCEITWSPQHAGNPVVKKQFREAHVLMTTTRFEKATISFTSDSNIINVSNEIKGQPFEGWGAGNFGQITWGGIRARKPLRTFVPLIHQRCRWLNVSFTHESAFEEFSITGMSLFYSTMSERVTR